MGAPKGKSAIKKNAHSLNADRKNAEGQMRSKATVKRLNMYRNGKERRDNKGKVVKEAIYQHSIAPGKRARIEPNRKWFGNTRVISNTDLIKYNEYATNHDSYQVTLKKTLMPVNIMANTEVKEKPNFNFKPNFLTKSKNDNLMKYGTWKSYLEDTKKANEEYNEDKDHMVTKDKEIIKDEVSRDVFKAGRSHRVWNELFKVIDSADVLLYVVDVRDPMGTRSSYIENYLRKEKPNKKMIFVLNKVDLVPIGVTKRWKYLLSQEYPTVAFLANMKRPFGRTNLTNVLKQIQELMKNRKQISVGIIGYPNVGKSSIINTLKNKKVCKVAPIAGETKVWQFVTLFKTVHLIDCPGVVNPQKATETELVLKGSVRVEKVDNPEMHIPAVMAHVKPEVLQLAYNLTNSDWRDHEHFLELLARKSGRLLKGDIPDVGTCARVVLNDFQRGKLPYYVKPEGYDNEDETIADFTEVQEYIKEQAKLDGDDAEMAFDDDAELEEEEIEEIPELEESDEDDEIVEDIVDEKTDTQPEEIVQDLGEFHSGIKKKVIPNKKSVSKQLEKKVKQVKLTSKERRKKEREGKSKKTGLHYYDYVDVKNKKGYK